MLSLERINFAYDKKEIIKDVSLFAGRGEKIAVIGSNGAGKSTLIKIISGFLVPGSGSVLLSGDKVHEMAVRDRAKKIAFVPQEGFLPFSFSALEVVLMARTPHLSIFGFESEKDVEIAREAMRMTDSLEFADRPIDELSGGERQLVLLARAIAQGAPLLLLDEPTSHLDIRHQLKILRLLDELKAKMDLTVISAIHDLNLASHFFDRVIIIKGGRVVGEGRPAEVMTEEAIDSAFETRARIIKDPSTGLPVCLP